MGDEAGDDAGGMLIGELALRAGVTVRNIRAYQTRGLLPSPQLVGRTGIYGPHHLQRLQLVQELQHEGVNLQGIKWILDRVPPTGSPSEVRLLQQALFPPGEVEQPFELDDAELRARLRGQGTAENLERAAAMRVLQRLDDGRWRVLSPALLRMGEEVVALGVPLNAGLDALERLQRDIAHAAGGFLGLVGREIWLPFERDGRPAERWPHVRTAIERLRTMATEVMVAAFRLEMTHALERAVLGDPTAERSWPREAKGA